MARYIDTKKNLSEIENPVKNVDIGKAVDTSKNLTSLKTTSFGVLSNKSLEQLSGLLACTPVISFNEDTAKVTITCETVGSSIYYTLDGSTPSASKTKYNAPFSVDKSCTIKAIGVKSGLNNSAVSTLEVEYQGGGDPPITEEVNMIKKTIQIDELKFNEMIQLSNFNISDFTNFNKFILGTLTGQDGYARGGNYNVTSYTGSSEGLVLSIGAIGNAWNKEQNWYTIIYLIILSSGICSASLISIDGTPCEVDMSNGLDHLQLNLYFEE